MHKLSLTVFFFHFILYLDWTKYYVTEILGQPRRCTIRTVRAYADMLVAENEDQRLNIAGWPENNVIEGALPESTQVNRQK